MSAYQDNADSREKRSFGKPDHRLTASRQDAEDIVHHVFVGLPEALARYDERGQFGAWIGRVTTRVPLMRQRQVRRRGDVSLARIAEPATNAPEGDPVLLIECAAGTGHAHAAVATCVRTVGYRGLFAFGDCERAGDLHPYL